MHIPKQPAAHALPSPARRRFLKMLGMATAAPLIPEAVRLAVHDMGGGVAWAEEQAKPPVYFIEINLRDQWDFGHVFAPPGLATHGNLRRGETGRRAAMFFEQNQLFQEANNVWLSPQSVALRPHLDTIAMLDTCELSVGRIHGHEAANATRIPGRGYNGGAGRRALYEGEPGYHEQGNEPHYGSTPSPAALHNYWQKQSGVARNGLTFKGISRAHTVYHFGAGLPGAELDRVQSVESLLQSFPDKVEDYNILPTPQEAELIQRLLKRADKRYFDRYHYSSSAQLNHDVQLTEAQKLIYVGEPKIFKLALDEAERGYWSADVPDQQGVPGGMKANIWEQVAYAYKLIANDVVRSVALEFDYVDVHDQRTVSQMEIMAKQTALPLARLIEQLKARGIYDRTLIAIYSTDGGRSPAANSVGSEGKNSVMLAGGMIRGGYYGDVRVAGDDGDGHVYSYHMPDLATGIAINDGSTGNDKRVPGAHVWRTVMKALQIPDAVAAQFPDVAGAHPLAWMLR
jgi:hypothetical protein